MIGQKANYLFPTIYTILFYHILELYIKESNAHAKKEIYTFFGKNSAGYVFPCFLTILEKPSLANKFSFNILITQDKNLFLKPNAFILCDNDLNIRNLSSTCISMLGFSRSLLHSYYEFPILKIFPEFVIDKENICFSRDGFAIEFCPPSFFGTITILFF